MTEEADMEKLDYDAALSFLNSAASEPRKMLQNNS